MEGRYMMDSAPLSSRTPGRAGRCRALASATTYTVSRSTREAGRRHCRPDVPIEYDLRHTFGTRTIAKADILRVKAWMGHADAQTTMR
jgi:integrase